MTLDFGKIMEGFMQAQIAANRRGDFSQNAGIDYLNGVNDALATNNTRKRRKPNENAAVGKNTYHRLRYAYCHSDSRGHTMSNIQLLICTACVWAFALYMHGLDAGMDKQLEALQPKHWEVKN